MMAALILAAIVAGGGGGGGDVPLPGTGLRVLIVEDATARTAEIVEVINGEAVRSWLDTHCAKGDDGNPSYRILPKGIDATNLAPIWREALSVADVIPPPAIVITNGRRGYKGPLPLPAEETLALLKKYGGA